MICCFWKQTTLELYELYQLGRLGWRRNLILSQLDSDWKIITFLISPFPCTIVGLWVLGNCRGINCGQILSLNKTCSNSSGNPTHKSHSYPFPPTPPAPASERHKLFRVKACENETMFVEWSNGYIVMVAWLGEGRGEKETIILANDHLWYDTGGTPWQQSQLLSCL